MAYINQFIDLHAHLDGSITLDIAKKLGEAQGIDLPSDDVLIKQLTVPEDCTSLNDFLECFALPLSLMQTKEGLSLATKLVADNMKSQGVVYAELRYAPQLHTQQGLTQEDAILAVLDGIKKTDLKVNIILCFMRGIGNEAQNLETLELAKKYVVEDGGVVAVDLAGAEALFPTITYEKLFEKVRQYGLKYTIHAGEADGVESVKDAISFGAKRIGHGVRSFEEPLVLDQIRKNGVFLEMCPTSNRQTVAIADMSKYPLVEYLRTGIRVTVNTDDMAIEGTYLEKEFDYLEQEFGLTKDDELQILKNSVDAAFTSQIVKENLRKQLGI